MDVIAPWSYAQVQSMLAATVPAANSSRADGMAGFLSKGGRPGIRIAPNMCTITLICSCSIGVLSQITLSYNDNVLSRPQLDEGIRARMMNGVRKRCRARPATALQHPTREIFTFRGVCHEWVPFTCRSVKTRGSTIVRGRLRDLGRPKGRGL